MRNEQLTTLDLVIKTHLGLERLGPGSLETTLRALSFLENPGKIARIADMGCGTGGPTMILAQNTDAEIIGVDIIPEFIDVFNQNAQKLNVQHRVKGVVGSIDNLPFNDKEFDLMWSEGVIDNIGFAKALKYWHGFLKKDGYVAVTCPTWFTEERPSEAEQFWVTAVGGLDTLGENIAQMQRVGFAFVAAFTLPEKCWIDHYFTPRQKAEKTILSEYPDNKTVKAYFEEDEYEVGLYLRNKQYYGYAFYIGQKR